MTALAEALGHDSARRRLDSGGGFRSHAAGRPQSGRRIVEMVWEDLTPKRILTDGSFDNAIMALMAMGGSTNAIIHLSRWRGRAGYARPRQFRRVWRETRSSPNIRPSGRFLMEDFYYAGGLSALFCAESRSARSRRDDRRAARHWARISMTRGYPTTRSSGRWTTVRERRASPCSGAILRRRRVMKPSAADTAAF